MKCTALFTFILCCCLAQGETIELRNSSDTIEGAIQSAGVEGLLLQPVGATTTTVRIPWSNVKKILPLQSRPTIDTFLQHGEELWRAKTRLLQGNVLLSQPTFEKQFHRLKGHGGIDARVASEGLLRLLLAQGLLKQAVEPWIETARLEELGVPSQFQTLEPILEDGTLICKQLPITEVEPNDYSEQATLPQSVPVTRSLVSLVQSNYRTTSDAHPFSTLVAQTARGNTDSKDELLKQYPSLTTWKQIWADYSLSQYFNSIGDDSSRNVRLARVASANPLEQPFLTGKAMLELAEALENQNLHEEARRIRLEATRLYPTHPLLEAETN